MSTIFNFNTNHKDLIHDVSFDYYGAMIATCSSDQTIKIWKYNDHLSYWTCMQEINKVGHTHKAAIQMICWANPIFGSIFASCSTDKKINIFALTDSSSHHFSNGSMYNFGPKKEQQFSYKRVFIEFHNAESMAFVPKNLGLKLSIVCQNGVIKILTCRDITNLSQWTQEYSINISYNLFQINISNPIISHTNFQSPKFKKSQSYNMDIETEQYKRNHSECINSYCISWNKSEWELPSFAVGTNRNRIFIYKYFDKNILNENENKNKNENEHKLMETATLQRAVTNLSTIKKNIDWHCVCKIQIRNGKNNKQKNKNNINVRSISWSRHLGKKYHLLGIGSSDGYVRIIKIIRNKRFNINNVTNENKIQWDVIFESNIHKDSVWKVKWNITGNVLLSAGDDAKIYLWKRHQMIVEKNYVPTCISKPQSDNQNKKKLDDFD